jgi:hypothetical protein
MDRANILATISNIFRNNIGAFAGNIQIGEFINSTRARGFMAVKVKSDGMNEILIYIYIKNRK